MAFYSNALNFANMSTKATPVGADTALIADSAAGGQPKKATLTSIIALASGLTYTNQTTTPVTLTVNSGYSANNAGLVTFNMPATVAFGSIFIIKGQGAGGWLVQMNTGQVANVGNSPTTSAGSIASTNRYDQVTIFCSVANTTFTVSVDQGNVTVA